MEKEKNGSRFILGKFSPWRNAQRAEGGILANNQQSVTSK